MPLRRALSATLEVTRFRQTGVIAVDAKGAVTHIEDLAKPADPTVDYHFTFRQLGNPQLVEAPVSAATFVEGCPPGHDADPRLTTLADALDRDRAGTDMVRFREPAAGAEQWLGRETPFDSWQTWDDPRTHYPGHPTDILDTPDLGDSSDAVYPAAGPVPINEDDQGSTDHVECSITSLESLSLDL